jgi:hypothetical protein
MLLGGSKVFPITLGNGPPLAGKDPASGLNGWAEVEDQTNLCVEILPRKG